MDEPVVALSAEGGHTLIVFVEEGVRLALPEGQPTPGSAAPELIAAARPLTSTECIRSGSRGAWLIQASGPAWSDDAAADSCGLVFTALDGTMTRVSLSGRPPGPLPPDAELDSLLEHALNESGHGPGNEG